MYKLAGSGNEYGLPVECMRILEDEVSIREALRDFCARKASDPMADPPRLLQK